MKNLRWQSNCHLNMQWYPTNIGGAVNAPTGVIVIGDLTEDGKLSEWDESKIAIHWIEIQVLNKYISGCGTFSSSNVKPFLRS